MSQRRQRNLPVVFRGDSFGKGVEVDALVEIMNSLGDPRVNEKVHRYMSRHLGAIDTLVGIQQSTVRNLLIDMFMKQTKAPDIKLDKDILDRCASIVLNTLHRKMKEGHKARLLEKLASGTVIPKTPEFEFEDDGQEPRT